MKYTVDDLILDLKNKEDWNVIQQKYMEAGLNIKMFNKEDAERFRNAFNEYKNVKYFDELPPVHVDIARKK